MQRVAEEGGSHVGPGWWGAAPEGGWEEVAGPGGEQGGEQGGFLSAADKAS